MPNDITFTEDLAFLMGNEEGLYEGTLHYYFAVILDQGENLGHAYHNFRHMMHVTCRAYEACRYYRAVLSPRAMRTLLIAAMFHDFNHRGTSGNDRLNIERSLSGIRSHIAPEDRPHLDKIESLIEITEYPPKVESVTLELSAKILRDADLSQALAPVWFQQVIIGLAREWNKHPVEVLKIQEGFLSSVSFATQWGEEQFGPLVTQKVNEAKRLLASYETGAQARASMHRTSDQNP